HAERGPVELLRRLQVGDGDTDVVDGREQRGLHDRDGTAAGSLRRVGVLTAQHTGSRWVSWPAHPHSHTSGRPTMAGSVIVSGARTPMGRLLGSLKDFSGADLGGHAIKAALERAGISGDQVQYVIMGQVLQAGAGQIP